MSGLYPHRYSPARAPSPHIPRTPERDNQYFNELVAELHKLGPFVQVLPICHRLLNHELARVSGICSNQVYGDYDALQHGTPSPMASPSPISNIGGPGLGGWGGIQHEKLRYPPGIMMNWNAPPVSPNAYIVKKILRLEIPMDTYPNFNFVGRLLGPRGNSLKRVEAATDCRVYIRGKGSIKDPEKEEKLRGRPGYEHLDDPLHLLIEAELPANVIDARMRKAREIIEELLKPVQDESHDTYKKQQLRELAILNSNFREDSPTPSSSSLTFENGLKRAKTGW